MKPAHQFVEPYDPWFEPIDVSVEAFEAEQQRLSEQREWARLNLDEPEAGSAQQSTWGMFS